MLVKLPFDITIKRPQREFNFVAGDVVNIDRWPEIKKAIEASEKKSKRHASPENKMITEMEEK